jgi:hypothetical protein
LEAVVAESEEAPQVSAMLVERDRDWSETALARLHRTALVALLIFVVELGLLGLEFLYGIHRWPGLSFAGRMFVLLGCMFIFPFSFGVLPCLVWAIWPVNSPQHLNPQEYVEWLNKEAAGPSIAEALAFRNAVLSRARWAKMALMVLWAVAAGIFLICVGLKLF